MQAILDAGTEIGALARRRFEGGVLVDAGYRQSTEALRHTRELLANPAVPAIFEGAFAFEQVLVRVDILERVTDGGTDRPTWRLIEVKSSTKVKAVHLEDLTIQAHVVAGAGVALAGSHLMHINTQYVYGGGDIDLIELFSVHDLTAAVAVRQATVAARLADMHRMLVHPFCPDVEPSGHCHQPYTCPFWDHCTKDKPKRWIYHLPGDDRLFRQLTTQGIETIDEIPASINLSVVQRRMRDNMEWIGPGLKDELHTVRYPVHHLDFETFMPAIPKFPQTRPYQTIPTQWSNHIHMDDGRVRHDQYLCMEAKDFREELTVALLESLGRDGSICVYSGYERSILEGLADLFPSLRPELRQVINRLWDLYLVIREHYYHPAFEGSFSIKSVLPAVVPSLGYGDLDIHEGGAAARQYYVMIYEEMDLVEKLRIREALLQYCERDTLAMLRLRMVLSVKARHAERVDRAPSLREVGPDMPLEH